MATTIAALSGKKCSGSGPWKRDPRETNKSANGQKTRQSIVLEVLDANQIRHGVIEVGGRRG